MIFRLLPESRLDRVAIDQAIDIRMNKQFKLETALIERNRLVNSLFGLIQLRFF